MKFVIPIIITVIIVGTLGYLGFELLQVQKSDARSAAIDGCLNASMYRNSYIGEQGNTVVTEEPIKTAVDTCLKLKNIK